MAWTEIRLVRRIRKRKEVDCEPFPLTPGREEWFTPIEALRRRLIEVRANRSGRKIEPNAESTNRLIDKVEAMVRNFGILASMSLYNFDCHAGDVIVLWRFAYENIHFTHHASDQFVRCGGGPNLQKVQQPLLSVLLVKLIDRFD
jgi:hypothetical protein